MTESAMGANFQWSGLLEPFMRRLIWKRRTCELLDPVSLAFLG